MFLLCSQMYILLFILIFLATVSVPVWLLSMRHNLSDCKQTFREYDLESYAFIWKWNVLYKRSKRLSVQRIKIRLFKLILYATTKNMNTRNIQFIHELIN